MRTANSFNAIALSNTRTILISYDCTVMCSSNYDCIKIHCQFFFKSCPILCTSFVPFLGMFFGSFITGFRKHHVARLFCYTPVVVFNTQVYNRSRINNSWSFIRMEPPFVLHVITQTFLAKPFVTFCEIALNIAVIFICLYCFISSIYSRKTFDRMKLFFVKSFGRVRYDCHL